MQMATIGATPNGGVNRVALSHEDKLGRDLFVGWCKEAGCSVEIDQMGNIFASRAGRNNKLLPVLAGSHLDSQPTGGKYDGALGVLAALEVIETLNDQKITTEAPIEIVSWTNEEGARFAPAMIASGVFAGEFTLDYAYSRIDKDGLTLGDELDRIGYKGKSVVGNRKYSACFELHIEQGPILEAEKKSIGIVTGVQGISWSDIILVGKETHAGPTPMKYRIDPVKSSLPILSEIYALADKYTPHARATIGYLKAEPAIRNTQPGKLVIAVDLRHPDKKTLSLMHKALIRIAEKETSNSSISGTVKEIWRSEPVNFSSTCISMIDNAAKKLGLSSMEIISGAGHDSVYISRVAPTGMIFIPCENGLSHNEMENISKEDAANGTNVLLHAILEASSMH
jgi:N-carbamoyl-L-amino-acid hydrolase